MASGSRRVRQRLPGGLMASGSRRKKQSSKECTQETKKATDTTFFTSYLEHEFTNPLYSVTLGVFSNPSSFYFSRFVIFASDYFEKKPNKKVLVLI